MQCSHVLQKIGIPHRFVKVPDNRPNCQDCYEITINKPEMAKFAQFIGFSNPRKRKTLQIAIADKKIKL